MITTILNQVGILTILAIVGIIGVKTNILGEEAKTVIEKLVFYITLPLLIITRLSALEIDQKVFVNGFIVIISTYFILFLQIMAGTINSRLLKLQGQQQTIHILHSFLGNIVFLGFPLLDALYPGGRAILYGALYQLVMNTVLWTWGISKLAPEAEGKRLSNLKKLLNPNTIALVTGLSMMILKIKLPAVMQSALGGLGSTTLYLAMIYIGIMLANTSFVKPFTRKDTLLLSFSKLLLIPVILLFIVSLIRQYAAFEIDRLALSVLILEASMPCMTILVILARRYGADDRRAMENFVASTVLSLLTLPVILWLMEKII